ncbi:hypothetical protein D3C77_240990 [compost metagenome]
MKTLQKFSSVHAAFHNHFNQDRHLIRRDDYKGPTLGRPGRMDVPRGLNPGVPFPVHANWTSCRWTDTTARVWRAHCFPLKNVAAPAEIPRPFRPSRRQYPDTTYSTSQSISPCTSRGASESAA